jgi:hypothetical protein
MVQRVDVNGTIVEFPDGMSQEAMAAALTKLPKTGQAPAEPSMPAPVAVAPTPAPTQVAAADQTGAAFTYAKPFRRDDALKARAAPIKAEQERVAAEAKAAEIPFEAVYKDPVNLQKIMDYGALRFGKEGKPVQGESSEDYVKRFMTHMRLVDNNELNYFAEKDWLNSASRDEVLKAGQVYDLFKNVIPFTSKGGQPGAGPYLDYLKTVATPSTVLSLGASKLIGPAAKAVGVAGLPALMKPVTAARLAAVPVIEGGAAATQSVVAKKKDLMVKDAQAQEIRDLIPQLPVEEQPRFEVAANALEKEVAEGVSVAETALAAGFGATFGLIEPLTLAAASKKVGTSFGGEITLDSVLAARKKTNATPGVLKGDDAADEVVTTSTSVIDGRSLLDKQGDPTTIAQMQIKNSVDKQADLLAEAIWKQVPELRPVKDEQISDAVMRTFEAFDTLPDDVITSAFLKADVNQEQFMAQVSAAGMTEGLNDFAKMYKTTTSDAARILQSKSVVSRLENTLRRIDKESAARVDKMFGKTNPIIDSASTLKRFVDTADKNVITAMTVNASTILRNAFAGTTGVAFDAAEEAIESTLFSIGNKLAGKPAGTFTGGMQKVTSDTLSTYYYLGQAGLSKELTEKMLENSPSLLNKMLLTTAEAAKSDLIKPVQILATPAVIMDTFVRRAVFSSSVERSLRQAGLDMYDVLAQGKNIPIEILQRGVDDAIAFTFSKQPTGAIGSSFVKTVEALRPVSTTLVPFARFMVNATTWTYQHYNPGFTASLGAVDLVSGVSKLRKGDDAAGYALLQRGTGRIAKQVTGTATILAAYAYRAENQDTPWNEVGSAGVNADVKFLFPLSAPMAIGDFLYKYLNGRAEDFKAKELFETLVGLKIPSGMTKEDTALEALIQASVGFTQNEPDESALNRMKTATEKLFGGMFGRMTVPMNQISDVISAFSTNEAIPRDAFALREGEDERSFLQSVGAQVQRGIPILKQGLPEAQSATRDVIPLRETGMLKQATGLSLIPPKNQIEAAIAKYNVGYRDVFVTTGDRTVDAKAKKILAGLIPEMVIPTMEMDAFKDSGFDAQASSLKQSLRKAQAQAKDIAIKESIQDAYSRGKVPAIEQKMFEKIGDAKLKRDVLKMYKDQTGESLYTSDDFMKFASALKMAEILRKQPLGAPLPPAEEKAAGGVVGYATGGSVASKLAKEILGTSIGKSSGSLLKEAQDIIKKNASLPAPAPVAEQMKTALPLPKAKALPTTQPIEQPMPTPTMADEIAPEAPMARQMEEAMPTPAAAVEAAPMPNLADDLPPPVVKKVDEYNIPEESITFPDNYKDDFTDVDYNEDPTNNLFKDYSAYTEDILSKDNDVVGKTIDEFKGRKKLDDAISTVRKEREDAYLKISGSPDFLDFDPLVISTALAKTRERVSDRLMTARNIAGDKRSPFFGPEFDIENASTKEVDDFFKLATTEQKKLDQLRSKFETRPPVSLIHGQEEGTNIVTQLAKKGFMAPQSRAGKHAELNVGAPSFTKDPNINALIPKFGGQDIKAYGSVNIPYGDYIYRRINMPASVYDEANPYGGQRPESALFIYNRAITGAPDNAVPISLPKGYHLESEDIFLEADKLKTMGFSRPSARGGDKEALFKIQNAIDMKDSTINKLSKMSDTYSGILDKLDAKRLPSESQVYSFYKDVRDLFKNEIGKSESVSVTGGAGSRYVNTIRGLATGNRDLTMVIGKDKYPITSALKVLESELDRLATRKNNTVLTEKADNIRQLRVSLENISKQTEGAPSAETVSATSFRKGSSTDKIDKIKDEMSKLDQKISKEWDVDVIDDLKLDKEILQDRLDLLTKAIIPSERESKDKIMKITDKLARGGLATRR